MIKINKLLTKYNYTKGRVKPIKYIVLHYTGGNGDTALGNCKYFLGMNRNASAHYFVDDKSIWQSVEDNNTAWSVGAKSYKHKECRNHNSISIEMCSRIKNGEYYITEDTLRNAIELTKYLAEKYNIPIKNIIRHYDVTGKECPKPYINDYKWEREFKNMLTFNITQAKVNGKRLNSIMYNNENYIRLRDIGKLINYEVGYNKYTKEITFKSSEQD